PAARRHRVCAAVRGRNVPPRRAMYFRLRSLLPTLVVMDHVSAPTVLAPGIAVLRADNPSEMTLDGTNTYLLFAPEASLAPGTPVIVIDPGPELEEHLRALAVYDVQLVLITHRHPDHTGGIDRLRELTGAPVRAALEQ